LRFAFPSRLIARKSTEFAAPSNPIDGAAGNLVERIKTTAAAFPKSCLAMKTVVFEQFGEPGQVLHVRDMPAEEPGPNQVRARMLASPINPSDLLMVRGSYGPHAKLPATPGFEGVGVIDAVGRGLFKVIRGLRVGRRIGMLRGTSGNWRESVVLPARYAVPIPDDIPTDQAASFFVNPATVVAMVERVLSVRGGDWLLQTAAASALGKMIIRLGKHRGFRTINLVRRADQVENLRRLGADEVIATNQENVGERLADITHGQGVPFALDAVGGAMGRMALEGLGSRGRLLVYGALSGEPIAVDPRTLIDGQKRIEGFWLSEWAQAQGPLGMLKLFREIFVLMRAGVLVTDIAARYPLDEVQTAVREAEKTGRTGKILLVSGK
jgi:NADPH2:quinone reductase